MDCLSFLISSNFLQTHRAWELYGFPQKLYVVWEFAHSQTLVIVLILNLQGRVEPGNCLYIPILKISS